MVVDEGVGETLGEKLVEEDGSGSTGETLLKGLREGTEQAMLGVEDDSRVEVASLCTF